MAAAGGSLRGKRHHRMRATPISARRSAARGRREPEAAQIAAALTATRAKSGRTSARAVAIFARVPRERVQTQR